MYAKIVSLCICLFGAALLINSCIEPATEKFNIRRSAYYPAYQIDSAIAESRLIWAADLGNPQKAIDTMKPFLPWLDSLAHKYQDSIFWSYYVYSLFDIGLENQYLDQYDSSFNYLQKSYDLSRTLWGDEILISTMCLNKLSFYYAYKGDFNNYHKYLFKSYDIRRRILDKNDLFLSYAYGNIAGYYAEIGDFAKVSLYRRKAFEIYQHQFELWKYRGDSIKQDSLLSLFGYMPTLPKTVNGMLTSMPIRSLLFLRDKMSQALLLNNSELASYYNHQIDEFVKENPTLIPIANRIALSLKAEYYELSGNIDQAILILDSLATVLNKLNKPNHNIYFEMSSILIKAGKYKEARKIIEEKTVHGNSLFLNMYKFQQLAFLYNAEGNYTSASKIIDTAYKMTLSDSLYPIFKSGKINYASMVPLNVYSLSKLLHLELHARYGLMNEIPQIGQSLKILNLFDLYNSSLVYLQENNFSDEGKLIQEYTEYPQYEKAIRLAFETYGTTSDITYLDQVLKWSESHKAIELLQSILLKNELYNADAPSPILELYDLQVLNNGIKNKINQLHTDTLKRDAYYEENLQKSLIEVTADIEVLKDKNKALFDAYFDPNDRIQYPYQAIKTYLLKNDAVLIDYFIGDEYLQATLLSDTNKYAFSTRLTGEHKKALAQFSDASRSTNSPEDTSLAHTVYDLLIKPLEKNINHRHIIIIPDGVLYQIPFETLLCTDGEYLIEKHPIQYEYSSKLLLRKGYTAGEKNYAGFAPEYNGKEDIIVSRDESKILEDTYAESRATMGALKFNMAEVKEATQLMGGKSYIGPIVDKLSFKENSKEARIIHLAMHALTDDQNADYSQLFFRSSSGNEPLFAYELNEFELHTELAILSACNTGVGDYRRGDGVKSLARAFKAAGCKNILMSLWPANDASTKDIVIGFLKYVKSGLGKADALRSAKLDYLHNAPTHLQSPYYWAGLVLIGDNDVMRFDRGWNQPAIILVAIALFVLGYYFVSRKSTLVK